MQMNTIMWILKPLLKEKIWVVRVPDFSIEKYKIIP